MLPVPGRLLFGGLTGFLNASGVMGVPRRFGVEFLPGVRIGVLSGVPEDGRLGLKSCELLEFGSERTLPFSGRNEPEFIGLPRLRGLMEGPPPSVLPGLPGVGPRGGVDGTSYPPLPEGGLIGAGRPELPELPDRPEPPEPPERWGRGLAELRPRLPPGDLEAGEEGADFWEPPEDRGAGEDLCEPPEDWREGEAFREPPEDFAEDCGAGEDFRERPEDREDLPDEARVARDAFLDPPPDFETEPEFALDCFCLPASAVTEGPNRRKSEITVMESDQREVTPTRNGEFMAISRNGGVDTERRKEHGASVVRTFTQ